MKKYGASGWVSLGTAVAITSGTPAQIHASNTVASLMAANEEDYPFISFRVDVNSGQTTDGNTIEIFARCTDGTTQAPAPDSTFRETLVAVIPTDGTNSFFYEMQALNVDKNALFYIDSSNDSINVDVAIRMWDWDAPA